LNPDEIIQWLLDTKLVKTTWNKFLNEQMIGISDFGIEVNRILNKLRTDSEEAEQTNIEAGKKLQENENDSRR